ncbi:MAG: DUF2314 domain-containing protein [Paraclostridium sp.]
MIDELKNVGIVCKECSNDRRKEFQATVNIDEECIKIQNAINERKKVFIKVPFSEHCKRGFNPQIGQEFFYLNNTESLIDVEVEHMWLLCGDVNIEEKTVCGVLANKPVIFNGIEEGSIVVADYTDIEEIKFG